MRCVLLRKTRVRDGVKNLPRPKLTQEVLGIGDKEEMLDALDLIYDEERNASTEEIEVTLDVVKYTGQKDTNSYRPDNGNR